MRLSCLRLVFYHESSVLLLLNHFTIDFENYWLADFFLKSQNQIPSSKNFLELSRI